MTTVDSPPPNLTPASKGTPVSQWFSCCLPKAANKKSVSFPPDEKRVVADADLDVTEESASSAPRDFDLPDLADDPAPVPTSSSAAPKDVVQEFWRMILSVLLLQFLTKPSSRKSITASSSSSSTPTATATSS